VKPSPCALRDKLFAQVAKALDGELPPQRILDDLAAALSAAFNQSGEFAADFFGQTDGERGSHVMEPNTDNSAGQFWDVVPSPHFRLVAACRRLI
jgi:hypothetical protein